MIETGGGRSIAIVGERENVFSTSKKGDAICRAVDSHKTNSSVEFMVFGFTGTRDFSSSS